MRKYIPHILIISFVFLLAVTAQVVSYAGDIKRYREAVRKNPDDAGAHCNLGDAYHELGKYKEAIESFKQAIRLDPDAAEAHLNLGLVYVFLNDRASALEQYKILKKLDTELANTLYDYIEDAL